MIKPIPKSIPMPIIKKPPIANTKIIKPDLLCNILNSFFPNPNDNQKRRS